MQTPIKLEEQTLVQLLKIKIQLMEQMSKLDSDLLLVNIEIAKREDKSSKIADPADEVGCDGCQ